MTTYTIPLPWTSPPLTGNDRGHTRYSPFVRVKGEAVVAIRAAKLPPIAGANLTLHWRVPDRRRRDSDNLFPTLKAAQDALVAAEVIHEDSWITVPSATCRIHPPNGEPAAMWLEVHDLADMWRCDSCGDGYHGEPPDYCEHGATVCEDCRWCPDCATEERRP